MMIFFLFFLSQSLFSVNHNIGSIKTKPSGVAISVALLKALNLSKKKITSFEELALGSFDNLSYEDYRFLHNHLVNKDIKIQVYDKKRNLKLISNKQAFYYKTNALATLALFLALEKKNKEVSYLLSFANKKIFNLLKNNAIDLIDQSIIIDTIYLLIKHEKDSYKLTQALSSIIHNYTRLCLTKNRTSYQDFLKDIIARTDEENKQQVLGNKERGIILGSIITGTLLTAYEIDDKQEKRLWIIDSITNLTWAASTFLVPFPITTTIVSILAGGFSIAVTVHDGFNEKNKEIDLEGAIKEIEGRIEIFLLDAIKENPDKKLDALEILSWMRAAIHSNGLSD